MESWEWRISTVKGSTWSVFGGIQLGKIRQAPLAWGNDAMNLLPDGQQFKYKRDPKIVIGNWKLKTQNKQNIFLWVGVSQECAPQIRNEGNVGDVLSFRFREEHITIIWFDSAANRILLRADSAKLFVVFWRGAVSRSTLVLQNHATDMSIISDVWLSGYSICRHACMCKDFFFRPCCVIFFCKYWFVNVVAFCDCLLHK